MGDFYKKNAFTIDTFDFFPVCGVELKFSAHHFQQDIK